MNVLVTGAAGYLASLLLPKLARDDQIERIIGFDVRTPSEPIAKFRHRSASVLQPDLGDLLRDEDVSLVIHLAWIFNPTHDREAMRRVDVEGTVNVARACAAAGSHLLYLSSTTAYGAHKDNPARLREQDPTRGSTFPYSADKAAVESRLDDIVAEHPQLRVTRARPCVVLGRRTDNFVRAILKLPVLLRIRGYDPPLQFLHESDLVDALVLLVRTRPDGPFNIAPEETITLPQLAQLVGRRSVAIPEPLLRLFVACGWWARLFGAPTSYLDFIKWPWVADVSKARDELGFVARHSSLEAARTALAQPPT